MNFLPAGKLPPQLLDKLLKKIPIIDKNVILGPGTGLDCSVIDFGDLYLVLKSDPISLTSGNIGWYSVEINVNDIVTTGADPKWMLVTILLPENQIIFHDVENIFDQLIQESNKYGITIVGGHTEISSGVNQPIIAATMIGMVEKQKLITPAGVQVGDKLFLTKEIAIETIAILANDYHTKLKSFLSESELNEAQAYLFDPGISIYKEAVFIREGFGVTAMHDPTEGGIASALWELSTASNKSFCIDLDKIPISKLTQKICDKFSINPLNSISSGALLFTANPDNTKSIQIKFNEINIPITEIGTVVDEGIGVFYREKDEYLPLARPERDEITKIF